MTPVEYGLIALAVFLVVFVVRKLSGPSQPVAPIVPAGPSDIGDLATLHHRTQFIPVPNADDDKPSSSGLATELEKLSALHSSGALTETEFTQAKEQFLAGKAPVSSDRVSLIITDIGSNKIVAIQAIRHTRSDLDLATTKQLVDGLPTPQVLFQGLAHDDATRIKKYLNAAGVTVQLR